MTLYEFVNVDPYLKDKTTGRYIGYKEYMDRVIEKLGIDNIKPYIPFNIDYLREMYKKDEHFYNTSNNLWDIAANNITKLLFHNEVGYVNLSEKVCILEMTAIKLIEEDEK